MRRGRRVWLSAPGESVSGETVSDQSSKQSGRGLGSPARPGPPGRRGIACRPGRHQAPHRPHSRHSTAPTAVCPTTTLPASRSPALLWPGETLSPPFPARFANDISDGSRELLSSTVLQIFKPPPTARISWKPSPSCPAVRPARQSQNSPNDSPAAALHPSQRSSPQLQPFVCAGVITRPRCDTTVCPAMSPGSRARWRQQQFPNLAFISPVMFALGRG